MDLHLRDKVIVVTGASHGLGKSVALVLAEEGAKVAVNYRRSPEKAEAVVQEIRDRFGISAAAVPGDVAIEADVAAMFDRAESMLGPIDALVNNAAYCPTSPTVELSVDEFDKAVQTNLTGTFLMSRELIRRLLASGRRGKIVNISSQAAFRGSQSGKTAYDSTKMGIVGFTISLAREMAKHQINVNCVAPGLMYTEMIAPFVDKDPAAFNSRVPLGRLGKTEEIASMVAYLCSPWADYMTGATVDVSGGLAMH